MPITETVTIDQSQFPESVRTALLESLRTRRIQPKFHYDSYKQAERWLELHEAFSPARRDPECAAIYDQAFSAVVEWVTDAGVRVVGLGCGGGQKDARLLQLLGARKVPLAYLPCDTSVPLVLTAQRAAEAVAPGICVDPLVCDIGTCASLGESIDRIGGQTGMPGRRVLTFFGMIPNFEPGEILPRLRGALRAGDWLLLSANLAPGPDYAAGVRRVFGGYDNELTRQWLSCFLGDIGIERGDGEIRFDVEKSEEGYFKIVADFHFAQGREISVLQNRFKFEAGEQLRLFYSYRYTRELLEPLLELRGLDAMQRWISGSGEEGVFLCRRQI